MSFKKLITIITLLILNSFLFTNCGKKAGMSLFASTESPNSCQGDYCETSQALNTTIMGSISDAIMTKGTNLLEIGGMCETGSYKYSRIRYKLTHRDANGKLFYLLFQKDFKGSASTTDDEVYYWATDGECRNGKIVINLQRPSLRTEYDPETLDLALLHPGNSILYAETYCGVEKETGNGIGCNLAVNSSYLANLGMDQEGLLEYQIVMQIQVTDKDPESASFNEKSDWINGPRYASSILYQYPAIGIGVGLNEKTTSASPWLMLRVSGGQNYIYTTPGYKMTMTGVPDVTGSISGKCVNTQSTCCPLAGEYIWWQDYNTAVVCLSHTSTNKTITFQDDFGNKSSYVVNKP